MKKTLLTLLATLITQFCIGQPICATDDVHAELMNNDPAYAQRVAASLQAWVEYNEQKQNRAQRVVKDGADTVYEIPIVVHVMHTGGAVGTNYNKSDASIQAWIDYTNAIFAGTAPGYYGPSSGGVKMPFKLVLATSNECKTENAIIRYNMSSNAAYVANGIFRSTAGIPEDSIFSKSRWNPDYYYNIYIVNKIDGWDMYTAGSGVVGYAYFPSSGNNKYGTVMLSATVSTSDNTFAHEFGHSIGLYHTFQGGGLSACPPTESSCYGAGDYVCDTERHFYTWGACATNSDVNPCTGTNYIGTQYNVMSYGSCARKFTPGQLERAVYMMKLLRGSLLSAEPDATLSHDSIPNAACQPSGWLWGPDYDGIYSFQLGSVMNSSSGAVYDGFFYKDFTKDSCKVTKKVHYGNVGDTINYAVGFSYYSQFVRLYVDFNGDGIFNETTELVNNFGNLSLSAETLHTGSFIIPDSVKKGQVLRVRVMADYNLMANACSNPTYGQVEDYGLFVINPMSTNAVELKIAAEACGHKLYWQMPKLENIQSVSLESSINGYDFESIYSTVPTDAAATLEYLDIKMRAEKVYYRLVIKDFDNNTQYSNTVAGNNPCSNAIQVYPNPSNGIVTMHYVASQSEPAKVNVYDVRGRLLHSETIQLSTKQSSYMLNISHLPAAPYVLEVLAPSVQHKQGLIIK